MTSRRSSTTIAASPDAVWAVLADFGAISAWVPAIAHSCLLSDQTDGVGTVRRVQVARQTLVERVTAWDPPRELAYVIEGLPPMVGSAANTWRIVADDRGSAVTLTTEIDTGRNPLKAVVATQVLRRMAVMSELMLDGLADASTNAEIEEDGP